jgi:hypothetical protein
MRRKTMSAMLALTLLVPELLMAAQGSGQVAAVRPQPPVPAAPAAAQSSNESPQSVRPQPRARQRSYERETRGRRRSGVSKKEVLFLAGVAGTSMGIGALAGGAQGLAIGAIVGGWGAYAAHRLWRWIR